MLLHVPIVFVRADKLRLAALPLANQRRQIREEAVWVFHFNAARGKSHFGLDEFAKGFQKNVVAVVHDVPE